MTDSNGADAVSHVNLAFFKQHMATEIAQLHVALRTPVDDIVDTTRRDPSGSGTDGDGRLGAHLGTAADGVSLSAHGSLIPALLGQPLETPVAGVPSLACNPVGVGTLGRPLATLPWAAGRPCWSPRWGVHGRLRRSRESPYPGRPGWPAVGPGGV